MMFRKLIILTVGISFVFGQNPRGLISDENKFTVPFNKVQNLIIIPVQLNDNPPLNMILDTGSFYTVLADLTYVDSLLIKNKKEVNIGGLGKGITFKAYETNNNYLKVEKSNTENGRLIILTEFEMNLSERIGMPVHGIIGHDLMTNFVVEINYKTKRIKFYNRSYFYTKKQRKLKRYQAIPITISRGKPFVETSVEIDSAQTIHPKLLIDTGGWDALWLFESETIQHEKPQRKINGVLGFGLNGEITGDRTIINQFKIGNFRLNQVTASYPDSASLAETNNLLEKRDGSVGGDILSRFHVIIDYKKKKIYLKKNSRFKKEFHYNMSGLELIKPFQHIPVFEVSKVLPNSPAALAGIQKGDLIETINGYKVGKITLGETIDLFHSKPGKKITVTVMRNGNRYNFKFRLKELL